ncbi:MAG: DNA mismatch repair protein MutS [Bdellovibrionia bacterium]
MAQQIDLENQSPSQTPSQTPLMKQYWDLKKQAGDALLLFRMGDFYELFGDDAVEAARILDITLTSRDKNKANPMPMAGVPHHSVQGYLQRLLKAGKKVAIGEQIEDPATVVGKAIVKRDIVRTFTPGIQFESEGSEAHYLAILVPTSFVRGDKSDTWNLACLDASTGEALVSEPMSAQAAATELGLLPVRHLLTISDQSLPELLSHAVSALTANQVLIEEIPANYLSLIQAREILKKNYGLDQLGAFISTDEGIIALGILVIYAARSQKQERLQHLRLPSPLRKPKTLVLGPRVPQHLDLVPAQEGTPHLYGLINHTRSALGARQLKRWLLSPLKDSKEIAARQDAVREILRSDSRERLSQELADVYDLERILGRVNTGLANPRDTLQLGRSIRALSQMSGYLSSYKAPLLKNMAESFAQASSALQDLGKRIVDNQREEAPLTARDGEIFSRGTSPDLDHLIDLTENGQRWLVDLETREREATGITSLKVRYNRVFGYYLEVTSAHLKNVPAHYQRKQTMVGAERFFTEELKKFEEEILTASSRQKSLEQQLFEDLLKSIQEQTSAIMEAARVLGELDALVSLSRLADEAGWSFPEIDDSLEMTIMNGRHPLVDRNSGGGFVPNDLKLSDQTRLTLMITGPNMGGKSTVMRQVALIVILGQMGAPVPASEARWGSVSSLYTRIGAHDAIARGQSTFMVEMSELAHILHYADSRSLIILDEIGRGTSTYDGMSVAWATLEWICQKIKARTLFATHYHELTRLTTQLPLLANAHMAVESEKTGKSSNLRFLYKLKEGPTNESFGVHVAQIAGLPRPVIDRAWKVLDELENGNAHPQAAQLSLFDLAAQAEPEQEPQIETQPEPKKEEELERLAILEDLKNLNLNAMTPLQALNELARLQDKYRESDEGFSAGIRQQQPQDAGSKSIAN